MYNLRTKRKLNFVHKRLESKTMGEEDLVIIACGGYFCVAKSIPIGTHNEDMILSARCTKISDIHTLAACGKAVLPAGMTSRRHEALLPTPLEHNKPNITEQELNRSMPIALLFKI